MNMQQLMKQAKEMQAKMEKSQNEIDNTKFVEKTALFEITMTGSGIVENVKISKDFEKDEIDMLEDMIIVSLNNLKKQIDAVKQEKMGQFANIPGM